MTTSTRCSAFTLDCRYDKRIMKLIGNVYCPETMCSDILCVHRKTFQSLETSDYQCPQWSSTCQVRIIPLRNKQIRFSWSLFKGFIFLKRRKKSIQDVIGDLFCPKCSNEKFPFLSTNKNFLYNDCKISKSCSHVLNKPFKDLKPTFMLFGGDGTHCFSRKRSLDNGKDKRFSFWRSFSSNHNQAQPNLNQKAKIIAFMAFSCRLPIG